MIITSLQNQKIKEIIKLKNKKYRDINQQFIVFNQDLIKKHLADAKLIVTTKDLGISNQIVVTNKIMEKIKDINQEIIGIYEKFPKPVIEAKKIIACDDVSDPHNLAMILKAMDFYGFDLLLLSKTSVDIYQEKVINNALESFFKINFYETDLQKELLEFKQKGYKLYSTGLNNVSIDLKNALNSEKLILVLGNEGHGVSQEIMNISDEIIKISMKNLDSLNVSLAANIAMYHFNK